MNFIEIKQLWHGKQLDSLTFVTKALFNTLTAMIRETTVPQSLGHWSRFKYLLYSPSRRNRKQDSYTVQHLGFKKRQFDIKYTVSVN